MSIVATVTHLSYCQALVTIHFWLGRLFWQELNSSWDGRSWPQWTWAVKRGACCAPFVWEGVLSPRLTQCAWAEVYFRTKGHLDPSSHLATIHTGWKLGAPTPFAGSGAGSPSSTMWPGLRPTSIPSGILIHPAIWPQQTSAENWGVCPFFWGGELGLHLTQSRLGWGLPPHQVAFSSIQPFCDNRYGMKIGGVCPLGEGELGPHLRQHGQGRGPPACQVHLDPSNHLATIHQRYRQNGQTDRTGCWVKCMIDGKAYKHVKMWQQ